MSRPKTTSARMTTLKFTGFVIFVILLWVGYVRMQNYRATASDEQIVIRSLIARLKDKDKHVRASAAHALGKLGNPKAASALMTLADDEEVADVAMDALEKLNVDIDFTTTSEEGTDDTTWLSAASVSAENARVRVKNSVESWDPWVQFGALVIAAIIIFVPFFLLLVKLNRIFKFVDRIAELLKGKRAELIVTASLRRGLPILLFSLAIFGVWIAKNQLMKERLKSDDVSSYEIKMTKIRLAGRKKEKTAIPMLKEVLDRHYEKTELRWRAAYSLGQIGDPSGLEVVLSHIADPNEKVRQYCAWAVGNLSGNENLRQNEAVPLVYEFCTKCQQPITHRDRYCASCGERIERAFEQNEDATLAVGAVAP